MTYGFGSIISRAFKYANTALPKFSSWFWIVLFTSLVVIGSLLIYAGSLFSAAGFMVFPGFLESFGLSGLEGLFSTELSAFLIGFGVISLVVGIVLAVFFSFFVFGFFIRACKGKDLTLAHPWKMFGQGFLGIILTIVYCIPATIITLLLCLGPMGNTAYFVICGIIIPILLYIVTSFFLITALVRYGKTGKFGSAFHIRTIGKIISSAGWLRYLGFIILFGIILCAVYIVFCIVPLIGILMLIFALPFFTVFQAGFFSELYDCGNEYLNVKIE